MEANSKIKTDLELLTAVERGEVVTQMSLSKRIGVAVGLINALLKRATRKGYVKARTAPAKRYAYYLTSQGFAEKSRLVAEYLEVSLDFFRSARREYGELFERAESCGLKRLALVGSGELAEIAIMAAAETKVVLVAVVDDQTTRGQLFGLQVCRSLGDLHRFDALVITDSEMPQATFDHLISKFAANRVLAPALLRILRDPDGAPAHARKVAR